MEIKKSIEIKDARIQFISLVDKAANQKTFLITKQEDGAAQFTTIGRILKVDKESHYVTGVVYEPMTADAHDNFMTEAEIEKAAHWFLKNGDKVDIQHSFEEANGLYVVESSVTKSDCTVEEQEVKKGTWLMTVEVADPDVWSAIEKGEISGFSMGGVGKYAKEDVEIDKSKGDPAPAAESKQPETKEGLLKRLAKAMGFNVVEKGAVTELYEKWTLSSAFWNAFNALETVLGGWDYWTDERRYESDDEKIREALAEFSEIITKLLTERGEGIAKALHDARAKMESEPESVEKAGKKMSTTNKQKLKGICQSLNEFLAEFEDEQEEKSDETTGDDEKGDETDMNKDDIQKMIDESIAKVAKPEAPAAQPEPAAATAAPEPLTADAVQKMISEAIEKSLNDKPEDKPGTEEAKPELTQESVSKMIGDAISKALKARGVPTNVDDQNVEKQDEKHYLHGLL